MAQSTKGGRWRWRRCQSWDAGHRRSCPDLHSIAGQHAAATASVMTATAMAMAPPNCPATARSWDRRSAHAMERSRSAGDASSAAPAVLIMSARLAVNGNNKYVNTPTTQTMYKSTIHKPHIIMSTIVHGVRVCMY
jgi:hypothetical protein